MSLTPSLIWGLLFLLPGLIGNFWFRFRTLSRELTVAPPPTTSIEALGYLTFISFATYLTLIAFEAFNDFLYPFFQISSPIRLEIGKWLLPVLWSAPSRPQVELVGPFVLIALASALALVLAEIASRVGGIRNWYRRQSYGWLSSIIDKSSKDEKDSRKSGSLTETFAVSVFVLTNLSEAGVYLGYQGILNHIELGTDKQILNLHLSDCGRFLVKIGPLGLSKRQVNRDPIQEMHFIGAEIKNTAFNVYKIQTATTINPP